jgi:predicted CXXCH cytochrome family protein
MAGLPEQLDAKEDYMKIERLGILLIVAVLVSFGLSYNSFAFHSGGVADCMGCHEMHNAKGTNLLQASDASSTCLNCHAGSGNFSVLTPVSQLTPGIAPLNMGPGGDFGWLRKDYFFTVRGAPSTEMGQTHGHNVIATDFGLSVDTDNPTAPGGTFTSSLLACTSCHDMHGQGRYLTTGVYAKTGQAVYTSGSYGALPSVQASGNYATGVYRLLRGGGDTLNGVTFTLNPPVVVTNSNYNRSEFYTQTRTAYGSAMSDFCGVCHPDMHTTAGIIRHPTGVVMSGTVQGNYNSYVKSGDMTGVTTSSYLSLVPYEEGLTYSTANINLLKSHAQTDDSQLVGPSGGATIMCLSCHRAHATGFSTMTRWQTVTDFIVSNALYPGTDNSESALAQGHSSQETAAAYYNRNVTKFAGYQRQLCNKCHAMD